jgi:NADH-quinone oxidoreductase subunit A
MDQGTVAVITLLALSAAFAVGIIALSAIIGRSNAPRVRTMPYECGLDPAMKTRGRLSVKFFLVAVLFLIFDVEIVFLIPWAAAFRSGIDKGMAPLLTLEICAFMGLLALALAFAWARGALEWEK